MNHVDKLSADNANRADGLRGRIEIIDLLRGIALIAMTLFHFGWDLEMFGFAERGFASQPAMIWFARCIASSFLFIVGFSLVLAHANQFNRVKFLKRFVSIAGAAALITLATYIATPKAFIFFGILHHIALASLLGMLVMGLPLFVLLILSGGVLLAPLYARTALLDAPWWWWSGLNAVTPVSSDYVPIFPFFALVILGIAWAKLLTRPSVSVTWKQWQFDAPVSRVLKFIGRHSLVYYLLHQPIMIAFLYMFHLVMR